MYIYIYIYIYMYIYIYIYIYMYIYIYKYILLQQLIRGNLQYFFSLHFTSLWIF